MNERLASWVIRHFPNMRPTGSLALVEKIGVVLVGVGWCFFGLGALVALFAEELLFGAAFSAFALGYVWWASWVLSVLRILYAHWGQGPPRD